MNPDAQCGKIPDDSGLGRELFSPYSQGVIIFLRYLSFVNASVWAGASLFMIICVSALFSADLTRLLTPAYVGFPAEAIFSRYFMLQYVCAGVALVHLFAERLYLGRPIQRFSLWLLVGITCLGLLGGLVLQPKINKLHVAKYWGNTLVVRADAAHSMKIWHGISEVANMIMVGGILIHLFRVTRGSESSRFLGH